MITLTSQVLKLF